MKFDEHEQYLYDEWVLASHSARLGRKTTIVCLTMENGYEVVGTSACVDPDDYDREIGVYWATKDALKRVADIVGYVRQSQMV
ncbi:Gp49 family protein [Priestia sp. YIM B13551]|uniref:Gp49 family protein n=1 Tax=Priestia sp. YIM B13551 TaxID=3366306 RepID=UPI00366A6A77